MSKYAAIVASSLVILATGCQFSPPSSSGSPTGDASPAVDSGQTNTDAATGDASVDDAAPDPQLTDRGLIARYFIDEAPSGVLIEELIDSAPTPLTLDLRYDLLTGSIMEFTTTGTNRGLQWRSGTDTNDRARADISGTKVEQMLTASLTGTIEVVVHVPNQTGGGRIVDLDGGDMGRFTLRTNVVSGVLDFYLNGIRQGQWDVQAATMQRTVIHLVFDNRPASSSETVTLYANGTRVPPMEAPNVPVNESILIPANSALVLGNRDSGDRNSEQIIYYAALYAQPLDILEVSGNTALLMTNDDQ